MHGWQTITITRNRRCLAGSISWGKKKIKLNLKLLYPGWTCLVYKSQCFHSDSWQTKGLGACVWLRSVLSLWPVSVTCVAQKPEQLLLKDSHFPCTHFKNIHGQEWIYNQNNDTQKHSIIDCQLHSYGCSTYSTYVQYIWRCTIKQYAANCTVKLFCT